MRTFTDMMMELLSIAGPGIMEIVNDKPSKLNEHFEHGNQKSAILAKWNKTTEVLDAYMPQIGREHYHDEIHHRTQGYVYLRSLGVEPPAFLGRP